MMVAFWGAQKWPASDVSVTRTKSIGSRESCSPWRLFGSAKPNEAQLLSLLSCILPGLYLSNIKVTSGPFILSGLKIRMTFWNLPPRTYLWHLTFSTAVCSLTSFRRGEGQRFVCPTDRYAVVPKSQGDWYGAPQLDDREQMFLVPRTWAKSLLKADG